MMARRLLIVLAALLLIPAFVLPLWSITIIAPQYNDGLGMYIGLRDIWGHQPHDIQNINILNHYIGMRPIVPAEVDVLRVMPWALAALLAGAAVVALVNRRWAVGAWLIAFVALGVAGLLEFHSWNYDYGHNLSPDAPIKVPGMTYQPPLIGTTTLLTIRASSYPSWGTLFIGLSFLAGLAAFIGLPQLRRLLAGTRSGRAQRSGPTRLAPERTARAAACAALLVLPLLVTACASPRAAGDGAADDVAEFASDSVRCDFCDGYIPAERFGGEIVTRDGSTYRFMSIECMAGFVLAGRVDSAAVRTMRVVDYNDGERLIDARAARYVRSQMRNSPSGLNLLATETDKIAHNLHFFFGGTRLSWPEVLELVATEWRT